MRKLFQLLCLSAALLILTNSLILAEDEMDNDPTFLSLTRRPIHISKLPANISIISAKDIKESNAKSLDEVIGRVVGVQVSHSGSEGTFSTMRMRGVPSSSQVAVIIDDQPYGGFAADQNVDISQIPLENVERIEVVRGGSSVLYGANTTGGVVHIITKKKTAEKAAVSAGYEGRSYRTHITRGEVGGDTGRAWGVANVSYMESNGYQENSDVNSTNQYASLGTIVGANVRFGLEASRTSSESGISQGTTVPISDWDGNKERPAANPTKRSERDRNEGRFHLDVPLGSMGQIQSVFFGSTDKSLYKNSIGGPNFDSDFLQKAHVLGGDTRFIGARGFTGGVSYERDEQRTSLLTEFLHVTNMATYVQQNFDWQKVSFIPAVRYDNNGNFGDFLSPRISAVYQAAPTWAVSGNIARSYRAPSFSDLFFDQPPTFAANRNLKPETSWTYDLGNTVTFGAQSEVKLMGFYTDIRDRIAGVDRNGDNINETNDNVARSSLAGAELEGKTRAGIFSAWGNYTYQRSKQPRTGKSDYVDVALSPHHIANLGVDTAFPAEILLTNIVRYVGKQYSAADRTGTLLPSYAVWNARLSKRFGMGEIFVGVNNILDRHYSESFDFHPLTFTGTLNPMPTRNYFGGIMLRFAVAHSES